MNHNPKHLKQQLHNALFVQNPHKYEFQESLLPDDKKTLILAEVEKKIYDWATKNNGAIVKSDRRTYAYFIEKKDLERIKEEKFDVE